MANKGPLSFFYYYFICEGKTSAGTLNYQMQTIWGTKYDSFDLESLKAYVRTEDVHRKDTCPSTVRCNRKMMLEVLTSVSNIEVVMMQTRKFNLGLKISDKVGIN